MSLDGLNLTPWHRVEVDVSSVDPRDVCSDAVKHILFSASVMPYAPMTRAVQSATDEDQGFRGLRGALKRQRDVGWGAAISSINAACCPSLY
jgi:hypothetical protein